jgi:hypothetical protein
VISAVAPHKAIQLETILVWVHALMWSSFSWECPLAGMKNMEADGSASMLSS